MVTFEAEGQKSLRYIPHTSTPQLRGAGQRVNRFGAGPAVVAARRQGTRREATLHGRPFHRWLSCRWWGRLPWWCSSLRFTGHAVTGHRVVTVALHVDLPHGRRHHIRRSAKVTDFAEPRARLRGDLSDAPRHQGGTIFPIACDHRGWLDLRKRRTPRRLDAEGRGRSNTASWTRPPPHLQIARNREV